MESTSKRGFAAMSIEKRRAISAMGGAAVPPEKRTFSKSKEAAIEAGRKGGSNVPPDKRTFSRDPAYASDIGRRGGHASRKGKK